MPPISSEVTSLGHLIRSECTFIIPRFQRNYVWHEDHVEIFWRDLFNIFADEDRDYFLGAIVVTHRDSSDPVVIDGQQRLITTSILVAALRNLLWEHGEVELAQKAEREFLLTGKAVADANEPRILLNQADRTFYDQHIIARSSAVEMKRIRRDDTIPISNRLIADCFCFMHRQLERFLCEDWSAKNLCEAILKAVDEKIYVIRLDVRSDYDAFILFETMNDRGLALSESDLLKNYLLSAAGSYLDTTLADWRTIEGNLGDERVVKFVRHYWLSSRGMTSRSGLFPDIKRFISTARDVSEFTDKLAAACEYYSALRDPSSPIWAEFDPQQNATLREQIEFLGPLRSDQIFIVLLAGLETDREGFPELLAMLNSFTFRYTTICNFSPSALLPAFISAAQHIRAQGRIDYREIFEKYLKPLYPDDSQFHSAFARKTIRYNNLARYILIRLNNEITRKNPEQKKNQLNQATDLEHILPKRFHRDWTVERKDFPGGAEKYVHRLGNMTLLTKRLNRELGSQPYEAKRGVFAEEPLEITRMLASEPRWTADAIGRRQNWMAGIAIKIWRCP